MLDDPLQQNRCGLCRFRHQAFSARDAGDDGVPHHRFEEFLFVRKIEIERALGDAGPARYVVEPGRGEAALGKAGQRRGDDLAGTILFAASPANGRPAIRSYK